MDYQVLKTELTTDPLGDGYVSMTDKQAADALNAKTRAQVVETHANAKTILARLGATDGAAFLDALESLAASNSAVKWALKFITSPDGIDVGNPETRTMLDQLAAVGALSLPSVEAIKALAEQQISRAEELGLGFVKPGDVQYAREMV